MKESLSKLEPFIKVIVGAIILTLLVLYLLTKVLSIYSLTPFQASLSIIKDVLFSLTGIILELVFLGFLVALACWIRMDEGILIRPFEIDVDVGDYNGQTISNTLITDLQKILQIHNWASKFGPVDVSDISKESKPVKIDLALHQTIKREKSAYESGESFGSVSAGSLTFSLGQLLVFFKRHTGNSGRIIAGSLQKHGSKICLIASMEQKGAKIWEVQQNIGTQEKEDLSPFIKDLALKIYKDMFEKGISAKTWLGFKYYTQALEEYYKYVETNAEINIDQSRGCCLQALQIEADYKQPAKLLYILALTVLGKGNYSKAEKLFRESINLTLSEPDADMFFGLGTALHNQRKNSEAIANYDISIMLQPSRDYTWANKGNALADLEQYTEAIECYDKAIKLSDSTIRKPEVLAATWYLRGFALYNCHRYQDAIESYNHATEIDPSFAFAWTNKGSAYSELGKEYETKKEYNISIDFYKKALNSYDNAIKLKPKDDLNWYNRGLALYKLGNIYCTDKELCDEGIDFLNNAVESYDCLLTVRNFSTGLTFINEPYIDALIDKGNAFAALGAIYSEIKKSDAKASELYKKAIESYKEAIKIDPQSGRAYYCESLVLRALHQGLEAEEAIAKAKELGHPTNPSPD